MRYWSRVRAEQERPPVWWRGRQSRITRWIAASQRRRPKAASSEMAAVALATNVVAFRRPGNSLAS